MNWKPKKAKFQIGHWIFKLNLSNIEDFVPFDVTKHLCISQKFIEVNVKHVTWLLQHDVVVVSVTNSQHVGSHTVASTRSGEVVHSLEKKIYIHQFWNAQSW